MGIGLLCICNTHQGGSKRKVLVAKVAVKLKFQSPNWQMQRNALLLCFWSGFCLIDCFIKAIAASYPRISVEHYWLLGTFLLFPAGAFSLSSFEPLPLRILFFFLFFDRTLAANACLCRCTGALSKLKPELKKTHVDDWSATQTDSQNV